MISSSLAIASAGPWFQDLNYDVMDVLFRALPHGPASDRFCEFLVKTPLASTWIFGTSFYVLWGIRDEREPWRRTQLLLIIVSVAAAVLITMAARPWIAWPAPARNPEFQSLFPRRLQGHGTGDCFPSHATLAYWIVALGLWRLDRRLGAALAFLAFFLIAIPRVYIGGHYPIDILASLILGLVVIYVVQRCTAAKAVVSRFVQRANNNRAWEVLFFLWLFELASGFSGLPIACTLSD